MNRQPQTETATQTANATHKHIKNEKAKTVNWQNKKNKNLKTYILNIKKQTLIHNHKNEQTTTNRNRHANRQR